MPKRFGNECVQELRIFWSGPPNGHWRGWHRCAIPAACHRGATVVVAVDVLFAGSGSGVDALTLAVFVNAPAREGLRTMVTMADADGSIVLRAHVTRPSDLP